MLSLSRRQFSAGALTEMVVFAACCISTMLLAVLLHLGPYGVPSQSVFIPAVEFAAIMTTLGVIFALFRVGEPKSLTVVFARTIVVLAVGFPIAYAAFGYVPGGSTARQVLGSASLYALASVVLIRAAASMVLESGVGLQRILIVGNGAALSGSASMRAIFSATVAPPKARLGFFRARSSCLPSSSASR